jgi:bifunctional ADP-heptose synthase (sugar kinase/adenylyltransferase)
LGCSIFNNGLSDCKDVVFVEGDVLPGRKEQLHHLGISRYLLFVAGGKLLDLEVREQGTHFGIGELAAFNARRGGDAFNGGFAVALSEGRDVVEAVRFGCATAGISVTRPGTAPAMPSRAEIEALLARG